jgi:hypothetical protein
VGALLRRRAAIALPLVLAGALFSATAVAQAAPAVSHPGWRIVGVFGPRANGQSQISSVDAVGIRDAWLAGVIGTETGAPSPLVRHWNGRAWRTVATPPGLSSSSAEFLGPVVAASSASDAWVIGSISADTPYSVALHWNGARWARFRFPDWSAINSAAVFSRTDAWVFGQVIVGKIGPFVERYNGKRWRGFSVPIFPYESSAVSARDIWAVGQTVKRRGKSPAPFAAMHWNGRSWHATVFTGLHLPKGVSVNQAAIAGYSARNAWVLAGLAKGMGVFPGDLLLHWNGRRWAKVHVPFPISQTIGISQDGHGGIWLSASGPAPTFRTSFFHDSGGHWTRQFAPTEKGEITQLDALSWSSGANFGWAAGEAVPGDGTSQGELLRYTR